MLIFVDGSVKEEESYEKGQSGGGGGITQKE